MCYTLTSFLVPTEKYQFCSPAANSLLLSKPFLLCFIGNLRGIENHISADDVKQPVVYVFELKYGK